MYIIIAVYIRGPFYLLFDVLDIKGEVWEGVQNVCFSCIKMLKLPNFARIMNNCMIVSLMC